MDYSGDYVPEFYRCQVCGKTGIKLWRIYQSIVPDLLCAKCAAEDQGKDISSMDEHGALDNGYGGATDQIGWFIPAVPTEDETTYWGYSSVPERAGTWWERLPNN